MAHTERPRRMEGQFALINWTGPSIETVISIVHKPRCESLSGPFMAADTKIITKRATEIVNTIAHAMTCN